MVLDEKIIETEEIYKGNVMELVKHKVELPDGKTATRDIIKFPGGAMIIPITDDGHIIMVKQFRIAAGRVFLEMPAGKLDKIKDPMECAKRELKEETGYTCKDIKYITQIHVSPGYVSDVIYIYLATGLVEGKMELDDGEFIEIEKVKIEDLMEMIIKGEVTDAKTIIGAFIAKKYCC